MKKNILIKASISLAMIIVLVLVILYACVWSVDTTLFVGDTINSLNLNMYDDAHCQTDIYEENDKIKVLYFYDEVKSDDIEKLVTINTKIEEHNESIDIYLISSYKHKDENKEAICKIPSLDTSKFIFTYDDVESKSLLTFKSQIEYPLLIWTDLENTIQYSSEIVSTNQYVYINATYNNISIGANVGSLCFERDIETVKIENGTLVADSTFNVLNDSKVKIINFWGYWCTPCKGELIALNDVIKKYGDKVEFIAIHQGTTFLTDDDIEEAYDFINRHPEMVYTWAHDDQNDSYYQMLGGRDSYPMSVIVDGDGIVRFTRQGALQEEELDNLLAELTSK